MLLAQGVPLGLSLSLLCFLWLREQFFTALLRAFLPCDHTGQHQSSGQPSVICSLPGACSYTVPEAHAKVHWELGFSMAVIKEFGTYTARNAHLSARAFPPMITNGFQSWRKLRRHIGRKIVKSMAIVPVHPENQIEKKTREIVWLLSTHCTTLWHKWICPNFSSSTFTKRLSLEK